MSNKRKKIVLKYGESHKEICGVLHKLCNRCWNWLPCNIEYFYKNKKNKEDGLYPYCKECAKKSAVEWNNNNHDKLLESYRKINATPKRIAERKEYILKCKENGKFYEWDSSSKKRQSEYSKNRQHKNHIISKKEWLSCKKYFNNECAYCGLHINNHYKIYGGKLKKIDLHKEHVNHRGSVYLDNCVPSCHNCNSSKKEKSLEEWYTEDKKFYSIERLNRIYKWLNEDYKQYFEGYRNKRVYKKKTS